MSQINSLTTPPTTPPAAGGVGNSIEDLDLDVFLELLLTELQSQDPLEPLENNELLSTISQIREIGANDRLSETLDNVLLGQNVATATGLINTRVEALSDDGQSVVGDVQNVTINEGEPLLEVSITTEVSASDVDGQVPEGSYIYTVVYDTPEGQIGAQVRANTADFGDDFNGSVRVENIPDVADVPRTIYRTDDATGEVRLLQSNVPASVSTFTDVFADSQAELVSELPPGIQFIVPNSTATVRLSNVGNVRTAN